MPLQEGEFSFNQLGPVFVGAIGKLFAQQPREAANPVMAVEDAPPGQQDDGFRIVPKKILFDGPPVADAKMILENLLSGAALMIGHVDDLPLSARPGEHRHVHDHVCPFDREFSSVCSSRDFCRRLEDVCGPFVLPGDLDEPSQGSVSLCTGRAIEHIGLEAQWPLSLGGLDAVRS